MSLPTVTANLLVSAVYVVAHLRNHCGTLPTIMMICMYRADKACAHNRLCRRDPSHARRGVTFVTD